MNEINFITRTSPQKRFFALPEPASRIVVASDANSTAFNISFGGMLGHESNEVNHQLLRLRTFLLWLCRWLGSSEDAMKPLWEAHFGTSPDGEYFACGSCMANDPVKEQVASVLISHGA